MCMFGHFSAALQPRKQPYISNFCLPSCRKCTFMSAPCHLCHLWVTLKNRLFKPVEMVPLDFLCHFSFLHRRPKSFRLSPSVCSSFDTNCFSPFNINCFLAIMGTNANTYCAIALENFFRGPGDATLIVLFKFAKAIPLQLHWLQFATNVNVIAKETSTYSAPIRH